MLGESHSHVTTWAVLHDKVEPAGALKSIHESDDELMSCQAEYVSLRLGISDQVLREDLVLFQDFHGE